MNIKQSTLAAAVTAALAMGVAGSASASIYARSYLELSDLTIVISDNGGVTAGGATVTSFNITTTNTGTVTGDPVGKTDTCATPGTTCFYNNFIGDPNALDAAQAAGTGGISRPAENSFTFMGPGITSPVVYGTADSVIYTAELAGNPATNTEQIAESELGGAGTSASSLAEISSITGFTMFFTVDGANQIALSFDAAVDLLASAIDPTAIFGNAQANINVEFTMEQLTDAGILNGGNDLLGVAVWRPNGTNGTFNECDGGLTCTDTDGFDLNTDRGTTLGNPDQFRVGTGSFLGLVTGLDNGNWRLTLNATTSTQLSRTPAQIPEPSVLALMGIGLLGLGLSARRKKLGQ